MNNLFKLIIGFLGVSFLGLVLFYTFYPSDYDKLMKPVIAAKKLNPHLIVDGEEEPPWPDEDLNSQTILGVDSNHNEVRDDVEIWINRNIPDRNHRMSLKQYARSYTRELVAAPEMNKELSFSLTQKTEEANDCESTIFFLSGKNTDEKINLHLQLFKKVNTILLHPEFRDKADTLRFNLLAGQVVGGIYHDLENPFKFCDFKVEIKKTEVVHQAL